MKDLHSNSDIIKRALKAVVLVILILACIVGLDLYVFSRHLKAPVLKNIDVNLDPPTSDARIFIDAQMKLQSATTTFDLNSGKCEFYYRSNDTSPFFSASEVALSFPKITSDSIYVVADLHGNDFTFLRRVHKDLERTALTDSSVKIHCSISYTAKIYGMLPATTAYDFSHLVVLRKLQDSRLNGSQTNVLPDKQLMPSVAIQTNAISASKWELEAVIRMPQKLKKHLTSINGSHPLDSFTIQLPKISYLTSTVDRAGNGTQAYLKVRTRAITVDLMVHHKPIVIDIKISCTTRLPGQPRQENENQCSLFSALDLYFMRRQMLERTFLNITSLATTENFLTKLLGSYHYIRTVDGTSQSINGECRQFTSTSLIPLDSDSSPSQSFQCITVDIDGVYITRACRVVQKSKLDVYFDVYAAAGHIESTSPDRYELVYSWSLTLEFSAEWLADQLRYHQQVFWPTLSEAWQNLALFAGFNHSTDLLAQIKNELIGWHDLFQNRTFVFRNSSIARWFHEAP